MRLKKGDTKLNFDINVIYSGDQILIFQVFNENSY